MRAGWVWGTYAVALAWVGLLFIHVDRYINFKRIAAFPQEGRRLIEIWADRMAETEDVNRRGRLLRRFAGDLDSRSTALLNEQAQTVQFVGEPLPPSPRFPLSESTDKFLPAGTWAAWSPLWVNGRRMGYVAWIRDSSTLQKERGHVQRGLLAAWCWWAAAGAVGAVFVGREKPQP